MTNLQKMKTGQTLGSIAALGLSLTCAPGQNLLLNGSFELGSFSVNDGFADRMYLGNGATDITGWIVGHGSGNFWWLSDPDYNAENGSYCVDLDSNGQTPYTSISQTFSTTVGMSYSASAWFSSEGNGAATANVLINGNVIGSVSVGSGTGESSSYWIDLAWTNATFTFTASSTNTTLTFQDDTPGPFTGLWPNPLVDNASVVAVPEPSIVGLASLGVFTLACWRRRRVLRGRPRRRHISFIWHGPPRRTETEDPF